MAETGTLPMPMIIEEDEIIDDDFYEKIQAPKFVDLTAPDLRRSDDDRHWFCFRVGCDQKHEQELDSEAVYKNFVLRVMAARSPNVRLRKALKSREEASANLKCPKTAPPKSRVSRMALISSFSHKINDNNVKVKPLSKKVVAATPNAKVRQSPAVAKALTTPRNQKKVSNVEQLRTVQSKKAMNVAVPKTRVVAKALVFHSPKKVAVKTKSSIELNTPMKALCSAMKKLELGVKKIGEGRNNTLPGASSRKQFRGREVKSRVFDSLYSNNRKGPEANTVRCLKEKKAKSVQKRHVEPHEDAENDYSSDMEIDDKSRGGSLVRCNESATSGGDITSLSSSNEEENKANEGSENEERRNPLSEKGRTGEATDRERKDEENSLASDDKENKGQLIENGDTTAEGSENEDRSNSLLEKEKIPEAAKRKGEDNKENEGELTENDDKENASLPDENRTIITNNDDPKKAIFGSKHEDLRKTNKQFTSASTGTQVVKYKKLKPTNPKPFKLRTDERGILKEANLVKKVPLQPLKETTAKSGKVTRKCLNIDRTSEQDDTDNYSSCGEKSNQITQGNQSGSMQSDNPNSRKQLRLYATTPHRNHGPKFQKPIDLDNRFQQGEKAAKKLDDNCNRKSQMLQRKVVRPRVLSRKKEKVLLATPCNLSVIVEKPSTSNTAKPNEAAKPHDNDVSSPASKAAGSASRPCSRGRKALTVPKEPKFHSLHVPKRCTAVKQT
ncbi:hypothetical protein RIF29_41535 [Crotalaria pallida]|uniref:Uncharacterized protein n=1 Tax=Crotalaria pallida TaxID=3830 RepID=A0AAN9E5S0_CROPI